MTHDEKMCIILIIKVVWGNYMDNMLNYTKQLEKVHENESNIAFFCSLIRENLRKDLEGTKALIDELIIHLR